MTPPTLRVGLVGYAFMGAAHSHAWRTAPRFFDLPVWPVMKALSGRNVDAARDAAKRMGWESVETDWHVLIERADIDLIDICTPGNTHRDIAIAALRADKQVLCEKPLANSVSDAREMAAVATEAAARGVYAMCGFSYRRTPALALAKRFIDDGRLGKIRHVRAQYLQDWLCDENSPLTWRLDREQAGSGALGDIGAHSVDLAQWLIGSPITGTSALLETFVMSRPVGGEFVGLGGHGAIGGDAQRGPVTVDDAALFIGRFDQGALGIFEATRFALGRKNAMRIELNGTLGSIAFDFEESNILQFFDARDAVDAQGFRRIIVTEPAHPYVGRWWPAGHGLGYEHGFTHQVADLVTDIASARQPSPSFADAAQVQEVLDAVERSARRASAWQRVAELGAAAYGGKTAEGE